MKRNAVMAIVIIGYLLVFQSSVASEEYTIPPNFQDESWHLVAEENYKMTIQISSVEQYIFTVGKKWGYESKTHADLEGFEMAGINNRDQIVYKFWTKKDRLETARHALFVRGHWIIGIHLNIHINLSGARMQNAELQLQPIGPVRTSFTIVIPNPFFNAPSPAPSAPLPPSISNPPQRIPKL